MWWLRSTVGFGIVFFKCIISNNEALRKTTGKHARDTCYKYTPKTNTWAQTAGTMRVDQTHFGFDNHPNWGLAWVGGLRYVQSQHFNYLA